MVLEVEDFYGVYLLYNVNPDFKGRTYIGFTVNPRRRIQQHNKGKDFGGAKKTSGKGPWEMVLIVYGFPTDISALMFEWAWQHPKSSRRLRHIPGKRGRESKYDYCLRVVANMLRIGPWSRMPLTFHWILQDYRRDFPADITLPIHMAIGFGPITSIKIRTKETKKKKKTKATTTDVSNQQSTSSDNNGDDNYDDDGLITMSQSSKKRCDVCHKRLQTQDNTLTCVHPSCTMQSHMICLSKKFLGTSLDTFLLPIDGSCPKCKQSMLWGNLIRKKRGCYANLKTFNDSDEESDEDHWSEQLRAT